jgi:hypothetical protein
MDILIYCFKCQTKTGSEEVRTIESNGRFRCISTCCICGTKKSTFVSNKKQEHSGGDLVDIIGNTIGEIHLPGHNFAGPGTKLKERLARGDKGINRIDELAREHDISYSDSKGKSDKKELRHAADREMLKKIDEIENLTNTEKLGKYIVKPVLKTKLFLGLGSQKDIL